MEADALLTKLDRSPNVAWWDKFLLDKLFGLEFDEYEVLQDWILMLSERGSSFSEDTLTRAYETVALLARETEKVRRLMPR